MQITNQKPVELSPVYDTVITGDFDPVEYMKQTVVRPLFNPLNASQPVTFSSNGSTLSEDDVASYVLACCGDTFDAAADASAKELFHSTVTYFDKTTSLSIQELFAIQSAVKENLPFPTPQVVYTPATDVIPTCREFLAGKCEFDKMFASLAFYARPNTLGVYFANENEFDNFKTWLAGEAATLSALMPTQTNQLFGEFQKLDLKGLTESLVLRNDDGENNEEYSFARALVGLIMRYVKQTSPALIGIMPFVLGELYCPRTLVFVNVERHSRATTRQVADEWSIINKSLSMNIKVVDAGKLSKLTGTVRALKKISSGAVTAAAQQSGAVSRAARAKFRKTAPTQMDIARLIKRVISKMANVAKSENSYKSVKMTYARPNRRDPDNFNLQGKMVSTKYKPDIHVYLDTSGSISERNYQDAIKALIAMARKMNVNLYFNSFSDSLSQCSHLHTKDKSVKAVYAEFQRIPKVSGGTNYEQIWHYINASKKRKRELSLVMTDFEWTAPNRFVQHPKNLYYMPISHTDWNSLTYWAEEFCKSMQHIDPDCRKKLLF